ncbi:Probable plastidic glucose transporter 2 [Linum perenne]
MASRQLEAYSMYKRMPSRDHENMTDVEDNEALLQGKFEVETTNPSWRRTLPHVLVATIPSLLFGYHLGVVNEPLESISLDLGFDGHALAEGLVVSISLVGSLIGSLFSGSIVDSIGRCKAFQLSALPMILGPAISASTKTLAGMLIGRFLVGIGMGLGPVVASLYVTEISPAHVRGTYGSFIQIATCLGFLVSLFFGLPVREIKGWWRTCFWVSTVPAGLLALAIPLCVESPHWLFKQGKIDEAEAEFERLLGGMHVESAMNELHKVDRGDDVDTVKFSELLLARNFRGSIIAMALMDKQGRKSLLIWSFFGLVSL